MTRVLARRPVLLLGAAGIVCTALDARAEPTGDITLPELDRSCDASAASSADLNTGTRAALDTAQQQLDRTLALARDADSARAALTAASQRLGEFRNALADIRTARLSPAQQRLAAAQRKAAEADDEFSKDEREKEQIMRDFRAGIYCSECKRTPLEIVQQEHKTFAEHIAEVHATAVSPSYDEILEKERKVDDKLLAPARQQRDDARRGLLIARNDLAARETEFASWAQAQDAALSAQVQTLQATVSARMTARDQARTAFGNATAAVTAAIEARTRALAMRHDAFDGALQARATEAARTAALFREQLAGEELRTRQAIDAAIGDTGIGSLRRQEAATARLEAIRAAGRQMTEQEAEVHRALDGCRAQWESAAASVGRQRELDEWEVERMKATLDGRAAPPRPVFPAETRHAAPPVAGLPRDKTDRGPPLSDAATAASRVWNQLRDAPAQDPDPDPGDGSDHEGGATSRLWARLRGGGPDASDDGSSDDPDQGAGAAGLYDRLKAGVNNAIDDAKQVAGSLPHITASLQPGKSLPEALLELHNEDVPLTTILRPQISIDLEPFVTRLAEEYAPGSTPTAQQRLDTILRHWRFPWKPDLTGAFDDLQGGVDHVVVSGQ